MHKNKYILPPIDAHQQIRPKTVVGLGEPRQLALGLIEALEM